MTLIVLIITEFAVFINVVFQNFTVFVLYMTEYSPNMISSLGYYCIIH